MTGPAPDPAPEPAPETEAARRPSVGVRLGRALQRNAWLGLVGVAALVVTRSVDFAPPPQVRMADTDAGNVVGEAPPQAFASQMENPQAVQVRATLRLYPDPTLDLTVPEPERESAGRLLSQPVVTTIYGMNATVNQTIRLEGGDLEVDLSVDATPRLAHKPRRGKPAPPVSLEHQITVRSRKKAWLDPDVKTRVHLDTSGFLTRVDELGHRVVFSVDEHLFSLDLELHRPDAPNGSVLAAGN